MHRFLPGSDAELESIRPFASVRLIVADLDGTLYPSDVVVTAQRLIRQLDNSGVRLTLATGRTITGIAPLLAKLTGHGDRALLKRGTPLILYNGSVVVDAVSGELLQRTEISVQTFRNILISSSGHKCEVFAYHFEPFSLESGASGAARERVAAWQFGSKSARAEREFNGCIVDWQMGPPQFTTLPSAILIKTPDSQLQAKIATEISALAGVSVTRSGTTYLELRPEHSNKGAALEWVARYLSLMPGQVLAIGDNDNDAEMLKWAGIGVAIGTASHLAKQNADFLCRLGPFQGVIEVLRLVHQARRIFRPQPRQSAS